MSVNPSKIDQYTRTSSRSYADGFKEIDEQTVEEAVLDAAEEMASLDDVKERPKKEDIAYRSGITYGRSYADGEIELSNFDDLDTSIQQKFDNNIEDESGFSAMGGYSASEIQEWKRRYPNKVNDLINRKLILSANDARIRFFIPYGDILKIRNEKKGGVFSFPKWRPKRFVRRNIEIAKSPITQTPSLEVPMPTQPPTFDIAPPMQTRPSIGRPSAAPSQETTVDESKQQPPTDVSSQPPIGSESARQDDGAEEQGGEAERKFLGIDRKTGMIIGGIALVAAGAFVYFKYIKK